jgi:hypothetical protein
MNRADQTREFSLSLIGVRPRIVNVIGLGDVTLPVRLSVPADKVRTVRVLLTVGPANVHAGSKHIAFVMKTLDGKETYEESSVFVAGDGS